MSELKRPSVLAGLIAEGRADPITAEERAIVAEIRAFYEKKYGHGGREPRQTRKSA
ncbi:hypothetical protein [Subtercola sp. RTI3]|uniref:hypothetical protein n=1 Tax=Subtercola sp. RTI3 TaxID=3048639 RepID=UPI002B2371E1|nr:hypothetical protein [Subtercola sp. RTI3]MEA9984625.1 hypothetical protein [Subtercola sp. RTI3]